MKVALLSAADVAAYRTLMLEAYTVAPDTFTSTPQERAAQREAWWIGRIADPAGRSVAFGAVDGDRLVGTVALEFSNRTKTRHKGLVIGMFDRPVARGTGIGRRLLAAAIAHAGARPGVKVLTLTLTEGNLPAQALYRSAGFQTFGVEPMAIRGDGGYLSKVHMWLPLSGAGAAT